MRILGIETSCDETSVAVLEVKSNKIRVLSNIVSSQVKIHAPYGGVVPSLAAREHERNLIPVLRKALLESNLISNSEFLISKQTLSSNSQILNSIDLIAVTQGPGLEIALWKGINFAKELARLWKKPIVGVNHLEAHIYSNFFKQNKKFKFPVLNIIVSGGHTQLVLMTDHGEFKIIGETQDDAAGEAFDKVARMLNLGFPGGPAISKLAKKGNPKKYNLPRPMLNQKNYNFSFSGLKTAVLYLLKENLLLDSDSILKGSLRVKRDVAASFQQAVIDVLVKKTIKAAKEFKVHPVKSAKGGAKQFNRVKSILLSGGVSANKLLRKTLGKESEKLKLFYSQPDLQYTGDNAAMIGLAGFYKFKNTKYKIRNTKYAIKAEPNLKIKSWIR